MYNIKYEIRLNEQGRPYIELPEDYEQRPEDRFFALEICRYMLQDLLNRKSENVDKMTVNAMDETEKLLGQLGDNVAEILYDMMRTHGELQMSFDYAYHIEVKNIEERDALPDTNIVYENKIFDRVEGLKVAVQYYNETDFAPNIHIYKLSGGIKNENWIEL